MKNNRRLRVRVRVRFILFHSELAFTDPLCNILQTLPRRKKYQEEMSDEQFLTFHRKSFFSYACLTFALTEDILENVMLLNMNKDSNYPY